jgi:hypothetical protein
VYHRVFRYYLSGMISKTALLDDVHQEERPDVELQNRNVILWGGEVLYRMDFREICSYLEEHKPARKILRTYGIPLLKKEVLHFVDEQFDVLRLVVPTFQKDALQWLTGLSYTPKHILKIIGEIQKNSSLQLEVEIPLTRPTMEHLLESISLLGQLRVSRVILRMVEARGSMKERYVMLAPRLGLLSTYFMEAQITAQSHHIKLCFEDIPVCMVSSVGLDTITILNKRRKRVHACDTLDVHLNHSDFEQKEQEASTCVEPYCSGVDIAYVQTFGKSELLPEYQQIQDAVSYVFQKEQSSKDIKRDLVWLSRHKPNEIHVWGDWKHPQSYDILRDIQRLSIPKISLWGDFGEFIAIKDREWFRLRQITSINAQIYGSTAAEHDKIRGAGDFQSQLEIVQKFPKADVSFVVLSTHNETHEDFILRWEEGTLPHPLKILRNKYRMETAFSP